jgi:hypothetical protein
MLTPALYTFHDGFINQTDFFHDDRFNLLQEAAAKLRKTDELYHRILGTWGECFRETIRTAEKIKTTEPLKNIRCFYTLEETPESLTMTVKTLCPTREKALFFKGSLDDFLARFSPSSEPLSAVYTFHDDVLRDTLSFLAVKENNPQEAAFRFKNMEKLYNVSTMTYPAAFVRANHDVEFIMKEHPASYVYTCCRQKRRTPGRRAYSRDTEPRLRGFCVPVYHALFMTTPL